MNMGRVISDRSHVLILNSNLTRGINGLRLALNLISTLIIQYANRGLFGDALVV